MQYGSNGNLRWNKEDESKIFGEADKNLIERFRKFHENNGFVYVKFFDKANQIMNRGVKRYSAWTIINVIRWEENLKTNGETFLINNDFIALYARLLVFHHPIFKDLFDLRTMKSQRKSSIEEQIRSENSIPAGTFGGADAVS